jgi:hypothetical protein
VLKDVKVAQSRQELSVGSVKTPLQVKAPRGYGRPENTNIVTLMKSAAAYKPLLDVATVIGRLNKGEKKPGRSEIQNLIPKVEALKNALTTACDKVLTELKDRAVQAQGQHHLVDEQMRKNGEMFEKLQDPSSLVDALLKSWPKGVTLPKDLSE